MSTDTLPRRGSVWQFRHGNRGLVDIVNPISADELLIRYRNTGRRAITSLVSFNLMYQPTTVAPLPDVVLDSEAPR